jgi:hypothetical protein
MSAGLAPAPWGRGSAQGRTFLVFALLQEGKADAALETFASVRGPERRLDVLQGQAFAEYARLEPRSYLAWRLREAPAALPR